MKLTRLASGETRRHKLVLRVGRSGIVKITCIWNKTKKIKQISKRSIKWLRVREWVASPPPLPLFNSRARLECFEFILPFKSTVIMRTNRGPIKNYGETGRKNEKRATQKALFLSLSCVFFCGLLKNNFLMPTTDCDVLWQSTISLLNNT